MKNSNTTGPTAEWWSEILGKETPEQRLQFQDWMRQGSSEAIKDSVRQTWRSLLERAKTQPH